MIIHGENEVRLFSRAWAVPPEVDAPCPVRPVARVFAPGENYKEPADVRADKIRKSAAKGILFRPDEEDVAGCFLARMLPQPYAVGRILLPDCETIAGNLSPDAGYILAAADDVDLPVGRVAVLAHWMGQRIRNARFGEWVSPGSHVRSYGTAVHPSGTPLPVPYDQSAVALLPTFRLRPARVDFYDIVRPQETFGRGYAVALSVDEESLQGKDECSFFLVHPHLEGDAAFAFALPLGTHVVFVAKGKEPIVCTVGEPGVPEVECVHPDSKLEAVGRNVIVMTDAMKETTAGGVHLHAQNQKKDATGVVVSKGPGCLYDFEVGDRVMYTANTATPITGDAVDANLRLMDENGITLVVA